MNSIVEGYEWVGYGWKRINDPPIQVDTNSSETLQDQPEQMESTNQLEKIDQEMKQDEQVIETEKDLEMDPPVSFIQNQDKPLQDVDQLFKVQEQASKSEIITETPEIPPKTIQNESSSPVKSWIHKWFSFLNPKDRVNQTKH